MYNIKLVVIFNHNYEKYIPILDSLYASQFPDRCYLVPFSRSTQANVIRVNEDGRTFSSHVAQAYERFKSPEATHYLFIADDLLLNPSISSSSLHRCLQLKPDEAYIKNIAPISKAYYSWLFYTTRALESVGRADFDYGRHLPFPKLATERFHELGIECGPLNMSMFRFWDGTINLRDIVMRPKAVFDYTRKLFCDLPYPFLLGYSDMFLIPSAELDQFSHFCGVLGAMNIFAEIAVPTAMALACTRIKTELSLGEVFQNPSAKVNPTATMRGSELWGLDRLRLEQKFNGDLSALLRSFPDEQLYVHPIKLSRWSLAPTEH